MGIERHEPRLVRAAAHGLKGGLASLGGGVASEVARRLETIAHTNDLSAVPSLLAELEIEIEQFAAFYAQATWE